MNSSIEKEFDRKVSELGKSFLAFPWEKEAAYARWLAQTYYFVKHTTVLVSLSAARFGATDRPHHYKMLEHLADERGHDLLALNDLENLGWKTQELPEYAETRLFYQNQYYMIANESPFSHLGYSLSLEGLAARYCPEVCERVSKFYGPQTCEFLRIHATVDQDHYADGAKELKNLTLEQASSALRNLEESCLVYTMILNRIAREAANANIRKSA